MFPSIFFKADGKAVNTGDIILPVQVILVPAYALQRIIALGGVYLIVERLVVDHSFAEAGHFALTVEVVGTGHAADFDLLPFVGA